MIEDLFADTPVPAAGDIHPPAAEPLPSLDRIRMVLLAHGVVTDIAADLPAGLCAAVAQLMTEAQAAPAGLPPADRVLCWVLGSELAKFAPTRIQKALAPWEVSNGEPMFPLYVPSQERL